jgi:hypothetical protein
VPVVILARKVTLHVVADVLEGVGGKKGKRLTEFVERLGE